MSYRGIQYCVSKMKLSGGVKHALGKNNNTFIPFYNFNLKMVPIKEFQRLRANNVT